MQLTLDHQWDGNGCLASGILGQTSVGSRVAVSDALDQQDSGAIAERLCNELSVHGQLFAVERPLNRQRRVALEDVAGQRDIVSGVQSILNPINA